MANLYTPLKYVSLSLLFLLFSSCSDESVVQETTSPPNNPELAPSATAANNTGKGERIEDRYIVIFKNQLPEVATARQAQIATEKTDAIFREREISKDSLVHQYKWASQGFAAKLTPEQVEELRLDPRIKHVVNDYSFKAIQGMPAHSTEEKARSASSFEILPWGVERLNGPIDATGIDKRAWILDTGIDLDHRDLNVDIGRSASFVATESADDELGHGTFVAGALAAKENDIDVIGVAAGATVVAVKVCNRFGEC